MTQATRIQALAMEIRQYCQAHADPGQANRYARYFKEGYDGWGLLGQKEHPLWNEKQKEWLTEHHALKLGGFLKLGELLFAGGKFEEGSLAIRFLKEFRTDLDPHELKHLARWFQAGIKNWAHTDALCGEVLAPLLELGQIRLEDLACWREAPHAYQRRAVPVAMLGILKRADDIAPLLAFLRLMMMDRERVVQQGLGWFLREAWKKHPTPVEAFLMQWKDDAPRVIFQYATEKMAAKDRHRFRRSRETVSRSAA
jgi:3-methyladenine DNA glycosylase AlkD